LLLLLSPACLPRCRRFALHAQARGSPRAVADLWSSFVSTLRLTFWDQQMPLPRMRLGQQQQQHQHQQADGAGISCGGGGSGSGRPEAPTLQHSLLHQKLQLLDLCIHLQQQRQEHHACSQPSPMYTLAIGWGRDVRVFCSSTGQTGKKEFVAAGHFASEGDAHVCCMQWLHPRMLILVCLQLDVSTISWASFGAFCSIAYSLC
jgi:hypothetical protein